jgi:hypothetical protein
VKSTGVKSIVTTARVAAMGMAAASARQARQKKVTADKPGVRQGHVKSFCALAYRR